MNQGLNQKEFDSYMLECLDDTLVLWIASLSISPETNVITHYSKLMSLLREMQICQHRTLGLSYHCKLNTFLFCCFCTRQNKHLEHITMGSANPNGHSISFIEWQKNTQPHIGLHYQSGAPDTWPPEIPYSHCVN